MSYLIQQSNEWLEMRRSMIGASDAPVIMGVSPWATPYKLYQEKLQLVAPKAQTLAMQKGIDNESAARLKFTAITGIEVSPEVVFHKEHEWMMASLDGISKDRKTMVEIKWTGTWDQMQCKKGKIPDKYYPQLQHQMEVCGLDEMYYFSYIDDTDYVLLKVQKDPKYVKKMIKLEKDFWEGLMNSTAPALTDRDYSEKKDDLWQFTSLEWISITEQIKHLESKEKELRELLIHQAGNQSCKGNGVTVAKVMRKGNVDYSKIPDLANVNLEHYRKETIETWRITLS